MAKKKIEEQVKRDRGRPKGSTNKPKDTSAVKVSKRSRGRPKKDDGSGFGAMPVSKKTMELVTGKRGRGRPKKVAEPVKRGKGRPKNSLNKKTGDKAWEAFTASQVTKKKRGRPAKAKTEAVEVVKKKRGRPAKVKTEAAPVKSKRGRKPGSTGSVLRHKRISEKVIKSAKLFGEAGKVMRQGKDVVAVGEHKRGRGRPKNTSMKKNTKAVGHANLFGVAEKVVGRKLKTAHISSGKKRGRPKGKKDTHPRARRGSKMKVGGTFHPTGLVAARLSHASQSPMVTTMMKTNHSPAVKMVAHRTPTVKIGKVTSRKGALKVSR